MEEKLQELLKQIEEVYKNEVKSTERYKVLHKLREGLDKIKEDNK